MNHQILTLSLPKPVYQKLQRWSLVTHHSLENLILQTLSTYLPPWPDHFPSIQQEALTALETLDDEALWQVARSIFPLPQQEEYHLLREQHCQGSLTASEQAKLEELSQQANLLMLRKAYAYVLLKERGYTLPKIADLEV